ncbi:Spermine synthase [Gemmatirosa kalamazoonensis]|uniref:Spermine synthase n=1 Tax=Gemmatirosa kalamazoonensis TaxID=861299 RepID=W0REK6_9BACT|nr:fused MFS/spermidine synthase [Gemmatirosa kalamazoonensis]AHG89544.1 Spermine synthase [Gemmatirosa kalamazoonensis]
MLQLLYILFTASGAAGLMYESIWSRYLGLFVGHSAYAQIIVLVIFLGGMSIGAWLAGRRSARLADPLRVYALAELGAGVLGALFHPVFVTVTDAAYHALFPALPAGAAVIAAKWLIAALLILPQSVLLGATFPLMSAGAIRRAAAAPGRTLSLLYFTNSLGAAAGVLVAGFWLLARVGLPGTLLAAAAVNALVAAGAWAIAWSSPPAAAASPDGTQTTLRLDTPRSDVSRPLARALLAVAFGTAVASFVYEVAWLRMLALVVGSATHSFEIMLSVFILGLALGAWWIRARADRLTDPARTLGILQWVMGSVAIATLPVYVRSFDWMVTLLDALDTTTHGYQLFSIARYLLCLAVMLPATFCAGTTLPLITRTLFVRGAGEDAIGRVYAVNTLGSIVGAALAGLVLMPVLGLKWLLVAGALVDVALGFFLLLRVADDARGERPVVATVAAVSLLMLLTVAARTPFHPAVLTSGVYRYARVSRPEDMEMVYYRDGRTATVSVRRQRGSSTLSLATNGKPDASLTSDWLRPDPRDTTRRPLTGDQVTQALLPLIALAHAPNARTAAVIGEGSGMTSHLLLASPRLQRLSTIDIEPEMIRASHAFYPANRRVFDDPRSTFVIDDAKSFFASSRRTFDVIVSEPSNPWVSGVSGLFTDDFYRRVRGWLAPGGVFGQWLHLYEIDDRLVLDVLAALHRNFAAYDVYLVSNADIFVVATNGPRVPTPDWGVVQLPGLAADLRRTLPLDSATLAAARLVDRAALAPLLDEWAPVNSDFHPVLDLGAERTRFMRRRATGFRELTVGRFDPVAAMRGWRVGFGAAPKSPVDLPRANALALGAAVRTAWARASTPGDGVAQAVGAAGDTAALRDALYRRAAYENVLASGRPPADWPRFVAHALDVLDDLHGGTSGVVDTAVYARLFAYLARTGAPPGAAASVHFAHGLAAWDWREAADAADSLVAARARGELWVRPSLLLDGAVVAALRLGDAPRAARLYKATTRGAERDLDDVRTLLLPAWIAAAGGARREAASVQP